MHFSVKKILQVLLYQKTAKVSRLWDKHFAFLHERAAGIRNSYNPPFTSPLYTRGARCGESTLHKGTVWRIYFTQGQDVENLLYTRARCGVFLPLHKGARYGESTLHKGTVWGILPLLKEACPFVTHKTFIFYTPAKAYYCPELSEGFVIKRRTHCVCTVFSQKILLILSAACCIIFI